MGTRGAATATGTGTGTGTGEDPPWWANTGTAPSSSSSSSSAAAAAAAQRKAATGTGTGTGALPLPLPLPIPLALGLAGLGGGGDAAGTSGGATTSAAGNEDEIMTLRYALASEMPHVDLRVAVHGVEVVWPTPTSTPTPTFNNAKPPHTELCVDVRLVSRMREPICGDMQLGTSASHVSTTRFALWSPPETLVLPFRVAELDAQAVMEFTVLGPESTVVGRAFLPVFRQGDWRMRRGKLELTIHPPDFAPELPITDACCGPDAAVFEEEEERRRAASSAAATGGKTTWLNRLAEARLVQVRHARRTAAVSHALAASTGTLNPNPILVLAVELPDFGVPVLLDVAPLPRPRGNTEVLASRLAAADPATAPPFPWKSFPVVFPDPSHSVVLNPVEEKYSRLSRSLDRHVTTHDPPNTEERARIERVLSSSESKPRSREEADLLWKFRNALVQNPRALTKFLASVDWDVDFQAQQAVALMAQWSAVDPADSLKLLSGDPVFSHPRVKDFAVASLMRSPDEKLQRYLPQLVQALRYDDEAVASPPVKLTSSVGAGVGAATGTQTPPLLPAGGRSGGPGPLARFLVSRAAANEDLATMLHWYLKVETLRDDYRHVFSRAEVALAEALNKPTARPGLGAALAAQDRFVHAMMGAFKHANALRGDRMYRTRRLKEALRGADVVAALAASPALPFNPRLRAVGVLADEARVLPSTTWPGVVDIVVVARPGDTLASALGGHAVAAPLNQALLGSASSSSSSSLASSSSPGGAALGGSSTANANPTGAAVVKVMFKVGDDLRQDQLVIQLMELMDAIFKDVGLDLEMTQYRALATGPTEGLVEFVADALPISKVKKEHGSIREFLARDAARHGGWERVLDRFVKSSAGYAVATYVLGIGDRHLDNILVRPTGHLFHVDFGYSFGRDKRLATPVRITEEMIEAMGGRHAGGFRAFRSHCCEAYKALRAQSMLLISVVTLMADAGLSDVSVNQAAAQVIEGLKLRLQLAQPSDDKAEERLLAIIDESVDALGPLVIEYFHNLAMGVGG